MRHPENKPGRLPSHWLEAIRGQQARASPGQPAPSASGRRKKAEDSSLYSHSQELGSLIALLKGERIAQGLSLSDIASISQQARSAISRLENGQYPNPTLNTLFRYSQALGVRIRFFPEPCSAERLAEVTEETPGREGKRPAKSRKPRPAG